MTRKAAVLLFASLWITGLAAAAAKKVSIDTPRISCAGGTPVSRSITICAPAGGTGLPAGFSLQWMTCDALAANGGQWFDSEDPRLSKASFSGNADGSRYRVAAGECVTVNIGDFLFDNGASTNSTAKLTCGTCYVFRAFGHANSTLGRSDFTSDLSCATQSCGGGDQCTLTFTDWRAKVPLCDAGADEFRFQVLAVSLPTELTLGSVVYPIARATCILDAPANDNGLIALAHQLIAAKLNVAKNGPPPASVATCIADADTLIGNLVVPPVGSDFLDPSATSALTACLASYNEGAVGPGACLPPDPGPD